MSPFPSDRNRRQRVRGIEAVARAEILVNELPTARILGESIDFSRKGQIVLRDGKLSSSSWAAGKSR
jgi:hypothetical protein